MPRTKGRGPSVVVADRDRDHGAWLAARRTGLGGSDIAAICGLSRWRSPLEVWLSKMDLLPQREESEAMRWGHALEEPIRREVARRLDVTVVPDHALYRAQAPAFALGSPDAIIGDYARVGEWKLVGARQVGEWDEGPPLDAELQARWYMLVLGYQEAIVAGLLGGTQLAIHEVSRDAEIEGMMVERATLFWRLVTDRIPPVMVGTAEERHALREAFPALEGEAPVPLDDQAQLWLRRRALAILDGKEAEQRQLQAENELRMALQGAREGSVGGRVVVRLNSYDVERIDAAALREKHPEVAREVTRTGTSERWWTAKEAVP